MKMTTGYNKKGASQYKQTATQSGIEDASPHRLIQMLMDGFLQRVNAAKGFMLAKDIEQKGENISWAISIVDGLRLSLDKSVGGDIVQNLDDLYVYMNKRLLEANLKNQPELLDEVVGLMHEIKSGWDAIPQDIIQKHAKSKQNESAELKSSTY